MVNCFTVLPSHLKLERAGGRRQGSLVAVVQLQLWGMGVLAPLQHLSCPSPQECQPHSEYQSPHGDLG